MKTFSAQGNITASGNTVKVTLEATQAKRSVRRSFSREFIGQPVRGKTTLNVHVLASGDLDIEVAENGSESLAAHPDVRLAIKDTIGALQIELE